MPYTFSPQQVSLLAQASHAAVVRCLHNLKAGNPNHWLPAGHAYLRGIPPRTWQSVSTANQPRVAELIAVGGPNHCIDGWGFLARALSSAAAGDSHAARHFAYYAQLRAALSILSTIGIGVFNQWNCVIDSNGNVRNANISLGTHGMAWAGLEHWARSSRSANLLGEAFSIRGVTFNDAVASMWPGSQNRPLGLDLILDWGVDLQLSADDKGARTESSYFPQDLNKVQCSADASLDFLSDFWDLFEPDPGDPLLELDKFLFRLIVETQYRVLGGALPGRAVDLGRRFANLNPILQASLSQAFLTRQQSATDPALFQHAKARNSPASAFELMARATLLLRTALSLSNKTLFDAGYNKGIDLQFWSDSYGQERGFWQPGAVPTPLQELWLDIRDALDDAEAARNASPAPLARADWVGMQANGLPRVFEAERIILWSLCA